MLTGRPLASFRNSLHDWFRQFQRNLPWRKTKDPYRIWLSEIMLQQTRVTAVIPYYEKFLERFPDIKSLAEAPEEEVLRLWSGLGYYSRARNLQNAARQIIAKFGGSFPQSRDEILSLSGIGDYTASAIASIAFNQRTAVLDGNVARVLSRLGAIRGDVRERKKWQALQVEADRLLTPAAPGDWNQAMMELGALVCTPRSPQCLLCPVAAHCEARKLGIAEALPEAQKKRDTVEVELVSLVLINPRGETLLLPPPPQKIHNDQADHVPTLVSNLWHFPTTSANGNATRAAKQTLKEFFRSSDSFTDKMRPLAPIRHAVTYRNISVYAFLCAVPRLPKLRGTKIVALSAVTNRAISGLTRKIARRAIAALEDVSD
jgi:A/G-specific adenine glycosylase